MKISNIIYLLTAFGFSFCFGEKNSSDDGNSGKALAGDISKNGQKTSLEINPLEKDTNFKDDQREYEYLIPEGQQLLLQPRIHYEQYAGEDSGIPGLRFSSLQNPRQNIHLSDCTGKYSVKVENLRGGNPSNFQSVLGAISAHILNQKKNQEYVPYPPNGRPHNYPGYRGYPRATEPPLIRTYERASKSNYGVQPVNFDRQNLRRLSTTNDYQPGFTNDFQNFGSDFYYPRDYFNDALYRGLEKSSEPIYESRWPDRGEQFPRPIK